jgi:hypothetical protein
MNTTAAEIIVDNNFVLACLVRTKEKFESVGETSDEFRSVLKAHPNVGVYKPDGARVVSYDDLVELLSSSEELLHEQEYWGKNYNNLLVVRLKLPEGWWNELCYIKLRHLMAGSDYQPLNVQKFGKSLSLHTNADLLKTDADWGAMSASQVRDHYGWITFKIHKGDLTISSWLPGRDTQTEPCSDLGDQYVRLVPKKERPPQQNQGQQQTRAVKPKFVFKQGLGGGMHFGNSYKE